MQLKDRYEMTTMGIYLRSVWIKQIFPVLHLFTYYANPDLFIYQYCRIITSVNLWALEHVFSPVRNLKQKNGRVTNNKESPSKVSFDVLLLTFQGKYHCSARSPNLRIRVKDIETPLLTGSDIQRLMRSTNAYRLEVRRHKNVSPKVME